MLLASLSILLWLISYSVLCIAQPFRPCGKCAGLGHAVTPKKKTKPCKRCSGKGARLRIGRRIYTAWNRTRDRGTR